MTGMLNKSLARKYVPHLSDLQAVCEANYGRLLGLLPDCDEQNLSYQFEVNNKLSYQIQILASSRYTSDIEMRQMSQSSAYLSPVMQVRLYHDARMAEVIKFQNIGSLKASYQYPNIKMHHKNEKEQVNLFLSEWLKFCIQHKQQMSSYSL